MNVPSTDVTPLYDRLLIQPIFDETIRGLIVPQQAKDKAAYFLAKVIAAGHGRVTESNGMVPLQVKTGDVVMVERKAGIALGMADGPFMMISEMHVLAVVAYKEPSLIVGVA